MTIETKNTIELGDITAISYQCKNCKATTVRLLDDKHIVPGRCGNCAQAWLSDGSTEHNLLKMLLSVLREFPKSSVNQHVAIRLEVAGINEEKR